MGEATTTVVGGCLVHVAPAGPGMWRVRVTKNPLKHKEKLEPRDLMEKVVVCADSVVAERVGIEWVVKHEGTKA